MYRSLTTAIVTLFVLASFLALWAFLQCENAPLPEPLAMRHGVCGGFMGVQHVEAWRQLFLTVLLSAATTTILTIFTVVVREILKQYQQQFHAHAIMLPLEDSSPSMKQWDAMREALARGRVQHGSRNA